MTTADMDTPSPLNILNADAKTMSEAQKESNKSAELAQASARQHVARRLAAAKSACDEQLAKIVVDITFFVETQIQQVQTQNPLEDEGDTLVDTPVNVWSAEQTEDDQESESDSRPKSK
jgi:hypothetical protein